jgi:hypothetical protein
VGVGFWRGFLRGLRLWRLRRGGLSGRLYRQYIGIRLGSGGQLGIRPTRLFLGVEWAFLRKQVSRHPYARAKPQGFIIDAFSH